MGKEEDDMETKDELKADRGWRAVPYYCNACECVRYALHQKFWIFWIEEENDLSRDEVLERLRECRELMPK